MDAAIGLVDRLAGLLRYPERGFDTALAECRRSAAGVDRRVAEGLDRFAALVKPLSITQLQEIYAETFDLNASCTLDVGWHLFGERRDRGAFLAGLRTELSNAGIDEDRELPDHLPHVLMLIGRVDAARAAELRRTIQPALDTLERALRGRGSPYEHLLASACALASRGA